MELINVIFILKLVFGFCSILLGAIALFTETKHRKSNRLTKWGKVAIWCVIVSGIVTFGEPIFSKINEDNQRYKETNVQLSAEKKATAAALAAAQHYHENAILQNENIKLTTVSLNKLKRSLINQDSLIIENKKLNSKQTKSLNQQFALQKTQNALAKAQGETYSRIKESNFKLENLELIAMISFDTDTTFFNKAFKICKKDWDNRILENKQWAMSSDELRTCEVDSMGISYTILNLNNNFEYIHSIDLDPDSPLIKNHNDSFKYNEIGVSIGISKDSLNYQNYWTQDNYDFSLSFAAYNTESKFPREIENSKSYKSMLPPALEHSKYYKSYVSISFTIPPPKSIDEEIDYYVSKELKTLAFIKAPVVNIDYNSTTSALSLYDLADKHLTIRFAGGDSEYKNSKIEHFSLTIGGLYHRRVPFKLNSIKKIYKDDKSENQFDVTFHYFLDSKELNLEPLNPFK